MEEQKGLSAEAILDFDTDLEGFLNKGEEVRGGRRVKPAGTAMISVMKSLRKLKKK